LRAEIWLRDEESLSLFYFVPKAAYDIQQQGDRIMRFAQPINAKMVALVSAGLHAGLAVLFVPVLSFVFLLVTGGSASTETGSSDKWMTLAVIAPLACGILGLFAGFFMASLFNLFVRQQIKAREMRQRTPRLAVDPIGDAA
jgi:hypothetical protein